MQDLRWLATAICCVISASCRMPGAEVVTVATWNLEWFPGRKPNSSQSERLVHMSAAKDALLELRPDILCLQEVRDWESVAELVSILPKFQTLIVSRFREMGSSGPLSSSRLPSPPIDRLRRLGPSPSNRLPQRRREVFLLLQSAMARPFSLSIACILRVTEEKPRPT